MNDGPFQFFKSSDKDGKGWLHKQMSPIIQEMKDEIEPLVVIAQQNAEIVKESVTAQEELLKDILEELKKLNGKKK